MPRDGIAQECSTSSAEINTRVGEFTGITVWWSTSSRRASPIVRSEVCVMYESNVRFS